MKKKNRIENCPYWTEAKIKVKLYFTAAKIKVSCLMKKSSVQNRVQFHQAPRQRKEGGG